VADYYTLFSVKIVAKNEDELRWLKMIWDKLSSIDTEVDAAQSYRDPVQDDKDLSCIFGSLDTF
jgi:hypothetical protein